MCIGVMYDRLHTRNTADYGGAGTMPKFGGVYDAVWDGKRGSAGDFGLRGRVYGDWARVKVNFCGRAGGADADLRVRLYTCGCISA